MTRVDPCPIDDCPATLPAGPRPMCPEHWFLVPPAIRVQVTLAYAAWRSAGVRTWEATWTDYALLRGYAVEQAQRATTTEPERINA